MNFITDYSIIEKLLRKYKITVKSKSKTKDSYDDFSIQFPNIPAPPHTFPAKVEEITIELLVSASFDTLKWGVSIPIISLHFQVNITGYDSSAEEYHLFFHLDPNLAGSPKSPYVHPNLHIQLGTKELKQIRNLSKGGVYEGWILVTETPRFAHHPMELFLGIDFIAGNFYPDIYNSLRSDHNYITIIKRYQEALLKPYYLSLASYWDSSLKSSSLDSPTNLLPYLC
ncbi:MAG: hypothetical protein SF053_08020 [Bacteroidia bacterium]|nr:hypothetical protein [Bacteroidia bacterium]